MNKRIQEKMFTFTVNVDRMSSSNSLGDKVTKRVTLKGYLKEEMKIVTDSLGKEVTSSAQVYLSGADMSQVDYKDKISVGLTKTEQKENNETVEVFQAILSDKEIIRRDVFYRPNNEPDVGVLYLP